MTKAEFIAAHPAVVSASARLAAARAALGSQRWGEARRFAGRSAGARLARVDKASAAWHRAWEKAEIAATRAGLL